MKNTLFFKKLFWHLIINKFSASYLIPLKIRNKIYRNFGMQVGNSGIYPIQHFNSNKIKIGENTFINNNCFFENTLSYVNIGNNCNIAMEVMFCGVTHKTGSEDKRAGEVLASDITIGDGTWIGTRVTILPGVSIGKGCIIAAGSIVTKDCKPNSLYAGVPAKFIKSLS